MPNSLKPSFLLLSGVVVLLSGAAPGDETSGTRQARSAEIGWPPGSFLAADENGALAVLVPGERRVTVWQEGKAPRSCLVHEGSEAAALLAGELIGIAKSPSELLVAAPAGPLTSLLTLELSTCRPGEVVTLEARVVRVAGSRAGWAALEEHPAGGVKATLFNSALRRRGETSPFLGEAPSTHPGARDALPVLMGPDLWLLPKAEYSPRVWDAERKRWEALTVPGCLRVSGFDVTPEENVAWLTRMSAGAAERDKPVIERMLASARAGKGPRGYVGAVAGAASASGRRLGVLLRTDRSRSCRLDVWDLGTPRLIRSAAFPGTCPGSLALSSESAWLPVDGSLKEVRLGPPKRAGAACE